MALSTDFLENLIYKNDIIDVVSNYVTLKRGGRTMTGLCPFHNEKSPSFHVYHDSNSFYCFGCGAGGDVITFIRKAENLDYIEAVKFLAQRVGMEVPSQNRIDDSYGKIKLRIYEANRMAARFFHSALKSEQGSDALKYLIDRQLTPSTITHFGLGFAPNSWTSLCDYLKNEGFSNTELISSNLAVQSRNGGIVDRFRNRVMFPIIDRRGNVIAFGGRTMEKDAKGAKYLNTSDTPVFEKGKELYAMNFAKNTKESSLILAEGYMDVIAMHQAGFTNSVATLGTALTSEQANLISRYTKEVVVCYDADEAGQKATMRAIPIVRGVGLNVRILKIPQGKDPDEFIKNKGKERFKNLIEQSGNDIEYRLEKEKAKYNTNDPQGKINFLKEAVSLLATLKNSMEQEIYASKLANEFQVEKATILRQINSTAKNNSIREQKKQVTQFQRDTIRPKDSINPQRAENIKASRAEESLISYLFNNPDRANFVKEKLPPNEFLTDFNRGVYSRFLEILQGGATPTISLMAEYYSIEEMAKITQIVVTSSNNSNSLEAENDYINVIKQEKSKPSLQDVANSNYDQIEEYLKKLREQKKK